MQDIECSGFNTKGAIGQGLMTVGENSNITIFEPNKRLSIASMAPEDFRKAFADYHQLLVLDEGDVVIAATRTSDRDGLLEAVDKRFSIVELGPMTFWDGPVAIEQNIRCGVYRSNGSGRSI